MTHVLNRIILTAILALFAVQANAMWIQPDWYEVTQPGVGTNRYAYSGNDPINNFDPLGNDFSKAPGDYDFSEEGAAREEAEMQNRDLDGVTDGIIIDKSIGHLSSGPGRYRSTQKYLEAVASGKIGPQNSEISRKEALANIRDLGEQFEQRSLVCDASCEAMVPGPGQTSAIGASVAVVGGVAAGTNSIPTRGKFKGSTPGTSPASIAARQAFGNTRIPGNVRLPAPTAKAPLQTSNRVGTVVGRIGPIGAVVGGAIVGTQVIRRDSQVLQCMSSCYSTGFLDR
ncbi:hypothetical protein BCF46_3255 [Litoreibacter meonggei]|uniref:RHS repeat-associated protein n=1 Tax=Litoreibacter meonggei TaxID=1049199 RepID=A0A497VNP2_9RHOB|nr:hypothetical protein [Litoreibacter meonggei]RLJ40686.1 hypothetical protein BCF46_3255 [Litoreibacter meonggei]